MRTNTQQIFERLSKGEFLSVDSSNQTIKHLFNDIEENYQDYYDYFNEIGFSLDGGVGYYYFSRINEKPQSIERKRWIN